MIAKHASTLALLLTGLVVGCGDGSELSEFDTYDTVMETCAESQFGFEAKSAVLTDQAEAALFEAVDQIGTDCEGGSIEIVSFAEQIGTPLADARAATVENAIVRNYGIADSRISKETLEAPSSDLAHHVQVRVRIEVPVIEE